MADQIIVATFKDTNAAYDAATALKALKDKGVTDFKPKAGVMVKKDEKGNLSLLESKDRPLWGTGIGTVTAARRPPNASADRTRWVPRLGRSRISGARVGAHTPVAFTTARARRLNVAPLTVSSTTASVPVSVRARSLVSTRAPWAAAVRASVTTRRASSTSWPSQ